MRRWHLVPIAVILLIVVALPTFALTESGLERDIRKVLNISTGACEPMTNLASQWQTGTSLSYPLDEPRAATVDGEIYLAGGITGLSQEPDGSLTLEPTDEVTRFDPGTETFTPVAPLPRPLNHIGIVGYDHDLYVVGGYGRRLVSNTSRELLRYDPRRNSWSRLPYMPRGRAAMATAVVGKELIVAGGARNNVPVAETLAFNFETERWTRLPSMLSRREHVGATAVGDKVYVFGGRAKKSLAVDVAESYDVSERRWWRLPPMPVGSGGLGAVAVGGDAIAVGGGNDGADIVTGAVQVWDPRTSRWSLLPSMRTPRHGQATAAVGNTIWVLGGSDCAYFSPTDSVESLQVPETDEQG